jgi:hypothetical protein
MKINTNPFDWLLIGFLLCLLLLGCKSKETTLERTKTSDTLITKSFKYVSQPIQTTITIDEICDSLGNVRKFTQVETSGTNKAKVTTKDNQLFIDLLTAKSETKTDTIYKTEYVDVYKDKEIVKYKTPLWMWLTIICLSLLILLLLRFR